MATYQVLVKPSARRELFRLPLEVQARILPLIDRLADAPRPSGVKNVEGYTNLYRLRVGDYRLTYTIEDRIRIVRITHVGRRSDVYRELNR